MKIGELAKSLNVTADTLRYYEKHGLLAAAQRSPAGYREYGEEHVRQLRFVLRAKSVGFSLNEIQDLLKIQIEKQQYSCEEVKQLTLQKREQVRRRIAELECFYRSLSQLADQCCGGQKAAEHCSILTALEDTDGLIK